MKPVMQFQSSSQRGAATLVVVMMLFLVMALLAAYGNRGLMFEQRLAASYFRTSVSQEAAEAGVEWTLAQLNGVGIDAACKPVAEGGERFADRYLKFSLADRLLAPRTVVTNVALDCARDVANEGWKCRCPVSTAARTAPAAIAGAGLAPSFGVYFQAGSRPGTLTLRARGCNDSVIDKCTGATAMSQGLLAISNYTATLGLVSAVRTPPAAPLVAKGSLTMTGTGLGLHNTDPRSSGLLLVTGGTWSGLNESLLESVPGTAPAQARVESESALSAASAEAVFKMFMGAAPSRYVQHPALRKVACNADCAGALETAYKAGQRILWVDGPLTISSNKTLGSADDPILVVANGAVTLSGPFQLNGMLVSIGNLTWDNAVAQPSLVNGMVLVAGNVQTTGRMDISYQQKIADHLSNRMGSFVRVQGGWIDVDL